MVGIPPEVLGYVLLGTLAYYGGLEAWHGLLHVWHALPAVGHGLLHVLTAGVK